MASVIGNLATVPSVVVGGVTRLADPLVDIYLTAWINGGNNASSPRLPNGTAGYQVPVGKTLVIWGAKSNCDQAAAGNLFVRLAYNNIDLGFNASTSASLVSGVYMSGTADFGSQIFSPNGVVSYEVQEWGSSTGFEVPAGKYVALDTGSTGQWRVQLYGYLK